MSVIEHERSAILFLALNDLNGRATKRANANTCLGIAKRCNAALQVTFCPTQVFGFAAAPSRHR